MPFQNFIARTKKTIARKTFKLRKGYLPSDQKHQEEMQEKELKNSKGYENPVEEQHSTTVSQNIQDSRRLGKKRCRNAFTEVFDNTDKIREGDRILLTMGKNENKRIPYFLKYYEELGIDHFLFIDNNSEEPMEKVISNKAHVSLWSTNDCYVESNFGVDWMNYFNDKYCVDHWVLTVDLDEFFVFPEMENRSYPELLMFLDTMEQKNLFAPLVDVYPKGPIAEAVVPDGEPPLKYANYFDSSGYHAQIGGYGDVWLRGGPRCRVFNSGDISSSPTLNKTPLVKWSKDTLYISSTHTLYPSRYNKVHPTGLHTLTAALLHTKFISEAKEKAKYAVENKNHYEGSREYKAYLDKLQEDENMTLFDRCSQEYTSSESLVGAGLMSKGLWGV